MNLLISEISSRRMRERDIIAQLLPCLGVLTRIRANSSLYKNQKMLVPFSCDYSIRQYVPPIICTSMYI